MGVVRLERRKRRINETRGVKFVRHTHKTIDLLEKLVVCGQHQMCQNELGQPRPVPTPDCLSQSLNGRVRKNAGIFNSWGVQKWVTMKSDLFPELELQLFFAQRSSLIQFLSQENEHNAMHPKALSVPTR